MGDAFGPLDKSEELLVRSMAYVGDRVIRLKQGAKHSEGGIFWDPRAPSPSAAPPKEREVDRARTELSMLMSP